MDRYTATEQAYKHGYEKGYEVGKKDATAHCEACANTTQEAIVMLQRRIAKQKWIPVSERLPEKWGSAIVYRKGEHYSMLRYTPALGWHFYDPEWGDVEVYDVTHWMPLPEPPKEGNDD